MRVCELIAVLADADPDSVVVFLNSYADSDESDEIREVLVPSKPWTHKKGYDLGIKYEVRYPGQPRVDDDGFHDVTQTQERVVVLSNGPTNLKYDGVV
ncbi:hypothetical protein PQR65_19045 [Paraburkholderia nemoris]|jgi:hypothetical protein|uniref:hypothetical protein n=1 Tax=Paraburkholderia nemoris TaxID=2793076 RepID=UPI0038B734D9